MAKLQRAERIPVSGPRDILAVREQDPNYVYRWVNDVDNRVDRFKAGGYEVVTAPNVRVGDKQVDSGSQLGSAVTKAVGGKIMAILMRIPKEWFDEDQQAKMEEVDAKERAMRAESQADYGTLKITRK